MVIGVRPVTRIFHGGVAYLKNRDQIITVGIIGHASAEDTKLLGGGGSAGMLLRQHFEIFDPQIAVNILKVSILPLPRYFVSFQIFYDPIRQTFLAPGPPRLLTCWREGYVSVELSTNSPNRAR